MMDNSFEHIQDQERAAILIAKQLRGEISDVEKTALESWIAADPWHKTYFERSTETGYLKQLMADYRQAGEPGAGLLSEIRLKISRSEGPTVPATHRLHFLRRGFFRYAAAIVLLTGVATIAVVMFSDRQSDTGGNNIPKRSTAVVLPGGDRAVLTLADGTPIVLDSAANGSLATQGSAQVMKLADGRIAYNLRGVTSGQVLLNTISTPKGGQYQVALPDGTKVWLNASSSITFPTAFTGNKRDRKSVV